MRVTWQESNNGNEWLVSCSDSPKYSQTAASYPRLLDRVGDSEEREGDRNVEKGCCTVLTKQDDIQGQTQMYRFFFLFLGRQLLHFWNWAFKWSEKKKKIALFWLIGSCVTQLHGSVSVMYVLLMKCKHALLQQTEQRCSCGHARQIPALGRYYTRRGEQLIQHPKHVLTKTDGRTDRQGHGRRVRHFTTDKAICARGIERGRRNVKHRAAIVVGGDRLQPIWKGEPCELLH